MTAKVLIMLLLSVDWITAKANSTEKSSVTAVNYDVETSHAGSTLTETLSLRNMMPTPLSPTLEKLDTIVNTSLGDQIKQSTPLSVQETQGLETLPAILEKEPSTPTTPTHGDGEDGLDVPLQVVSNGTEISSQSSPRKGPLPKDFSISPKGATGNRSSRQSGYTGGGTNNAKQNTAFQKPSVETARGKNWCAYVHTRLQPTIVVDNVESFASGRGKPCTWITGPCGSSSQSRTRQAYRIKHLIVTSLEWKCCPGYGGATCQPQVQQDQLLIHSNQAESNAAVNGGAQGNQQRRQQWQDSGDPAVAQKMNEQISSQETKLTLLQKKVDNISVVMSDVSKTLSSLEGKINEDKGRDVQAFLKGLKSKSITELVKEIVKEQFKVFQSDMQETMAQILRIVSGLSEDLEGAKALVRRLNASHQRFATERENTPTKIEILEIKSQMLHIEEEISITCDRPIKDLYEKQKSMEIALEHQSSKSNVYYESLNKTLTQIKQVHEQLLSAEQVSDQNIPAAEKSISDNLTDYMSGLHEKVRTQNLMVLQLYDDLRIQNSKISNLTVALEIQKDYLQGKCDGMLSKCREDFQVQLKDVAENAHTLNKTLENLVYPLDDKMDKMNEQINDLCYDMEILQPLIERGDLFSLTSDDEQQIATDALSKKLENLTSVVGDLNSTIQELTKSQKKLKTEYQAYDELSERRINECFVLMEDGLNKTMTVLNGAIDSIQDNYVLKETLYALTNKTEACCSGTEKVESIVTLIPQFQQMNKSLQMLMHENPKVGSASKTTWPFPSSDDYNQNGLPHLSHVHHNQNTTLLNLQEHPQDAGHQEKKLLYPTQEREDHEFRLQAVEAKIAKFLANSCVSVRNVKAALTEKDNVFSVQFQALRSRIAVLETKSIHVSLSMPLLNKTAYEARRLCQEVSGSIQKVNASLPRFMKAAQTDRLLFQKGFRELTESMLEVKAAAILSNLTWHVDKSLADAVNNITKRLKSTPQIVKKQPATVKKVTGDVSTSLSGRSQRNTDATLEAGDYLSCTSSPCKNGGTCINERKGFVCACRYPFGGANCSAKMMEENAVAIDFSKGSYRYAPMVAFFASHTYGMNTPGPIRFNNLDVNYGASYAPASGKFRVPYLGVYVFEYNIESRSPRISGYLVVDGVDKLAFQSENTSENQYADRVVTGDALLELNYGQEVWLRLVVGSIPAKYPPVTTFSGYLLYRT